MRGEGKGGCGIYVRYIHTYIYIYIYIHLHVHILVSIGYVCSRSRIYTTRVGFSVHERIDPQRTLKDLGHTLPLDLLYSSHCL
jgi:hypothetical protein